MEISQVSCFESFFPLLFLLPNFFLVLGVSNWKDMPTPGPIPAPIRGGPPGPRPSYPPNKSDVWGAGPSNRPWGEPDQPPPGGAPGGGSSGWGDPSDSMKPRDNLGWGETPGAGSGWGPAPTRSGY